MRLLSGFFCQALPGEWISDIEDTSHLVLYCVDINEAVIRKIASMPSLQRLTIINCSLSTASWHALFSCRNIKVLDIRSQSVPQFRIRTDENVGFHRLELPADIGEFGGECYIGTTPIKELVVDNRAVFSYISKKSGPISESIEEVYLLDGNMGRASSLKDFIESVISRLPRLKVLHAYNAIPPIPSFSGPECLEEIGLIKARFTPHDGNVRTFSCPNLKKLYLDYSEYVQAANLLEICEQVPLEAVGVSGLWYIPGQDLAEAIAKCRQVRVVHMNDLKLDDNLLGMALRGASNIEVLHLKRNSEPINSPDPFLALQNLTHLFLDGSKVSDDVIAALAEMPRLEVVSLKGMAKSQGVKKLDSKRPDCLILV